MTKAFLFCFDGSAMNSELNLKTNKIALRNGALLNLTFYLLTDEESSIDYI